MFNFPFILVFLIGTGGNYYLYLFFRGKANSESCISCFLIWIPFISFSALIAVAKTSKTMLNSTGKSGHSCVVPDFRGNAFNFSPLRIMFVVGLSYIAFIILSMFLLFLLSGEFLS